MDLEVSLSAEKSEDWRDVCMPTHMEATSVAGQTDCLVNVIGYPALFLDGELGFFFLLGVHRKGLNRTHTTLSTRTVSGKVALSG